MRVYLALAAVLIAGAQAEAQGIGARCAAEASARALHGQERVQFLAACKAAKGAPDTSWQQRNGYSALCSGSLANTVLGACPLCILLASAFDDGNRCYVR